MDPARVSSLRDVDLLRTGGGLSQFVHCLHWMSNSIPQFAKRSAIISDFLEQGDKRTKSTTKRSVHSISFENLSWDTGARKPSKAYKIPFETQYCALFRKRINKFSSTQMSQTGSDLPLWYIRRHMICKLLSIQRITNLYLSLALLSRTQRKTRAIWARWFCNISVVQEDRLPFLQWTSSPCIHRQSQFIVCVGTLGFRTDIRKARSQQMPTIGTLLLSFCVPHWARGRWTQRLCSNTYQMVPRV